VSEFPLALNMAKQLMELDRDLRVKKAAQLEAYVRAFSNDELSIALVAALDLNNHEQLQKVIILVASERLRKK
jgi:hypothetical protein